MSTYRNMEVMVVKGRKNGLIDGAIHCFAWSELVMGIAKGFMEGFNIVQMFNPRFVRHCGLMVSAPA